MIDLDFCSSDDLLMQRRSLRRDLSAREGLQPLRIAVLGGSTTDQIVNTLELFLLASGFRPEFHQSEYGRFYDDAVHDPHALIAFRPDLVYIHTSCRNVRNVPPISCTEEELPGYVAAELARFQEIWNALETNLGCQIIQNNFEMPPNVILGNMDAVSSGGE